jgi:hypothetical protein
VRPIANKSGARLADGRVQLDCTVGEFAWRCVCRAEDGHDHVAVVQQFAQNLNRYDAVSANLQPFVGLTGNLRGASYTIMSANVNVMGAGLFRVVVVVDVTPLDGLAPTKRLTVNIDYTDPSQMRLADISASFMDAIGRHGDAHAGAAQVITTFLS